MVCPSADELKLLQQIGEVLASHRDDIISGWQEILESTAVYHERVFSSQELASLCTTGINALLEAVVNGYIYSQPQVVRDQGAHFIQYGLGDKPFVESMAAWQKLCLPLVPHSTVRVTANALSQYCSLFCEGYLAAFRDHILDAQDEIIIALETSLRESEQWLATTLKSIGDGVITTDTKGVITFMNPVAELLTGWAQKEGVGTPLKEVFHIISEETRKDCENPFEKIMRTGKIVGLANNTVLLCKDGTERLIADSGAPIRDDTTILGTVLVFRDITDKRKMEEDILRLTTEKMESISILAGGIAHDFNNILTAILGNISIAKAHTTAGSEVFRLLSEAEKASVRAKNLTQQLLTFSKGGAPLKKVTSLPELLKDTVEFTLSGSKSVCSFVIQKGLYSVDVDAGQISQVINNLIINADHAMPDGGVITVMAENVTGAAGIPGDYVKITVKDEGIGIQKGHLQKIFEPYFTTKQKGSGLGLATSYSIVKNHGGHITVESALGVGTTFYVWLPACKKEVVVREESIKDFGTERGKILLMDDEESILEATGEVLTYLGYDVVTAKGGVEALAIYRAAQKEGECFDAAIIDLTIRGEMCGKETMKNLLKIDPDIKAIVSSGYADDPAIASYKEYGFKGVVVKPYTIDELRDVLNSVLHKYKA